MSQTYTGGCHCKRIRYTINFDPTALKASKCNCTICHATNRIGITMTPDQFTLVSPASRDDVPVYSFGSKSQRYYFCNNCGIHVWVEGSYEWEGKTIENMSFNAVTLDAGQEGLDLRNLEITYWDGRRDNWTAGEAKAPYEGGVF